MKRLALGLDRLDVQPGDIVLLYSPNSIWIPVAYLGIVGSSRAFSAINPIYTVQEVTHQLKNTGATALLVHPSLLNNALAAAKVAGLPEARIFQFDDKPCPVVRGVKDWREMVASPEDGERYQWKKLRGEESVDTVATINYSSGKHSLCWALTGF